MQSIIEMSNFIRYPIYRYNLPQILVFSNSVHPIKLLFLSKIEKANGLELLFEALSLIDYSWQLTIAASGSYDYIRSLKTLSYNLKIASSIHWIGPPLDHQDKFNLIADHDVLVFPFYIKDLNFSFIIL